jgi:carboxypeptidase C (cathepsin A)
MLLRRFLLLAALLVPVAALALPPQDQVKPQQKSDKATAQDTKPATKEDKPAAKDDKPAAKEEKKPAPLPKDAVSDGWVIIAGQKIEYKATAGMLPAVDKTGKAKANIFYTAYTRKTGESPATRRLTFCFNGGPGSASAFVHLGFFGPRRVLMQDDGLSAPAPAQLVENESSILDVTDLVFIDPVSTGYSRAEKASEANLFHGLEEDTQSVGDFIRDYVAKFERKDSPVYVAGESYGTTRAASLSSYLQSKGGVRLAGIILISAVLDFQTIRFGVGNDLPYALFLPTYTATAFFHGKLDKKWATDLQTALRESQRYANGPYLEVLHKGNLLSDFERNAAAKQLAMLTGLSEESILKSDLRIEATRFRMELLRDRQVLVGRLDSRVTSKPRTPTATAANEKSNGAANEKSGSAANEKSGSAANEKSGSAANEKSGSAGTNSGGTSADVTATTGNASTSSGEANRPRSERTGRGRGGFSFDPSQSLLETAFTDGMKSYLQDGLGYKTEARYQLSAQVQPWSYGQAGNNRYANVAPRLRAAMEKDKALRVLVASGYTDLATPYAGTNYTFAHLGPRALMDRVTMTYYDAGHMFYTHEPSRRKFRDDLVKYFTTSSPAEKKPEVVSTP